MTLVNVPVMARLAASSATVHSLAAQLPTDQETKSFEGLAVASSFTEATAKSWLQVPLVHEIPGGSETIVPVPVPRTVTESVLLAEAESTVETSLAKPPETERDADRAPP